MINLKKIFEIPQKQKKQNILLINTINLKP